MEVFDIKAATHLRIVSARALSQKPNRAAYLFVYGLSHRGLRGLHLDQMSLIPQSAPPLELDQRPPTDPSSQQLGSGKAEAWVSRNTYMNVVKQSGYWRKVARDTPID